jgi:hypothetical protein
MKKLEAKNVELRDGILDHMTDNGMDKAKVPSGSLTAYDEPIERVDPVELFERFGVAALAVMSVKIGEAKDRWGEDTLRDEGLIESLGSRRKLLARPAPKPKTLKVAC